MEGTQTSEYGDSKIGGIRGEKLIAHPPSYVQDTVADMAKDMRKNKTGAAQASAAELYDFMKKVTTHRARASHAVVLSGASIQP